VHALVVISAGFAESGAQGFLEGYRGSPRRDIAALEDVILGIGALVDDFPSIAELDLNPVLVHESAATIVDARIRVTS
jgi:acetate---CoA ligase (ADP-forming)